MQEEIENLKVSIDEKISSLEGSLKNTQNIIKSLISIRYQIDESLDSTTIQELKNLLGNIS